MRSLLIILSILLLSPYAQGESPSEKLKIGLILPLTGDAASVGEAIKNGVLLAHSKLPHDTREKLELVFEDDSLLPRKAVSAFNKLITVDGIDIVINYSSGTGKALSPIAEKRKVPLIAFASDPGVVKDRTYVFNLWVTPEREVNVLLPEIKKHGYKKISRVTSVHAWSFTMKHTFDRLNKGTVVVALDDEYELTNKDFKPYLSKLSAYKDTDAIFAILNHGHIGVFAKQARQMGISIPIFGFEMFEDVHEVEVSEGALVSQWYVNGDDPPAWFLKEYKSRFPDASLYAAPNGYDALMLIAKAIGDGVKPDGLKTFLHGLQGYSGALGNYSASGDNRFTLPAAVKIVTEDGFQRRYN